MAELEVTPAQLRAASNHLATAASDLRSVMSSLQAACDAEGAPWGGGDAGTEFATGGEGGGYLGQKQGVDDAISAKVDLLMSYSEGLRDTADNLEGGDSA